MILGQVTGAVWATRKCAALQGQTFLEVRYPGGTVVAADLVGAGLGDPVLVTLGSGARAGRRVCSDPGRGREGKPWASGFGRCT